MTTFVRWCCTPQPHINFITDNVTNWYMSRWTYPNLERHLTAICVEIAYSDCAKYVQQLLHVMKRLWIDPNRALMECGPLDTLLENKSALTMIINKYCVTYTDVTHGVSFYNHVMNTVELLNSHDWTIMHDRTFADNRTTFKLHCIHVSCKHVLLQIILYCIYMYTSTVCIIVYPTRVFVHITHRNLTVSQSWCLGL